MTQAESLWINSTEIKPGSNISLNLPAGKLYTDTPLNIPVHVIHSKYPGPKIFIFAAIHGDEINGVEIIRRLLKLPAMKKLHGSLIAVPIVNVHGLINHSRYLPDRRDLNRSFPGSEKGSLAARLAFLLMQKIVGLCTHGIDIHTGAIHRSNLPQVRANLDNSETERLARVFDVPVIINADFRDGSLRQACAEKNIPMLLYEAGEALRFDEVAIRAGVNGVKNVLRALDMLPPSKRSRRVNIEPVIARSSYWVRAQDSGILRTLLPLGARVQKNTLLAMLADPFGKKEIQVIAPYSGIVIGRTNIPLVNEGDALYHIARFGDIDEVEAKVDEFQEEHLPEIMPVTSPESPII